MSDAFLDHNIRHVIARDSPNPTGVFHTSTESVDSLVSKSMHVFVWHSPVFDIPPFYPIVWFSHWMRRSGVGGLTWWRHQMKTFSALLAFYAGNSPVTGEFPTYRPVTRSSDVLFDLRLNKRLSKRWRGWWSETPSRPLWRHCNDYPGSAWGHSIGLPRRGGRVVTKDECKVHGASSMSQRNVTLLLIRLFFFS